MQSSMLPLRLCVCVLLALCVPSLQAFDSGSTGADGAFAPQEDVLVVLPEDGILNYSSVNIPAGVTVHFVRNRANTPVRMLVGGDVNISGTIDVSGQNATAVGNGGDGNVADDGEPGAGGPGGYDGGTGGGMGFADAGSDQAALRSVAGGAGKGPGGGVGGRHVVDGSRLRQCEGSGGNHAAANFRVDAGIRNICLRGGFSSTITPYGTAGLLPLMGGSGGGGAVGMAHVRGAGGGGGGGAILIAASGTVNIPSGGFILANGGNAGNVASSGAAFGGGGSGGAVRVVATTIAGRGRIEVRGAGRRFPGQGGVGRISLEAENLNFRGSSSSRYSSSIPGLVFMSNRPRLSVGSVASVSAPPAPSGREDITLTQSSEPVQVSIVAGNIPLGTTVSLRVLPDNGPAVVVQGGTLSGTLASSSATATVTLPAGHSVLSASASFSVSSSDTALQSLYMPYTGGERVAKVSVHGDTGTLNLLTESGREVLVTADFGA